MMSDELETFYDPLHNSGFLFITHLRFYPLDAPFFGASSLLRYPPVVERSRRARGRYEVTRGEGKGEET